MARLVICTVYIYIYCICFFLETRCGIGQSRRGHSAQFAQAKESIPTLVLPGILAGVQAKLIVKM